MADDRTRWLARGHLIVGDGRPKVMGVVNVTPDSFSDGGWATDPAAALALALRLQGEGADLLDVGGESSRPGAGPVEVGEELRRVLPAVEAMAGAVAVPISVDTTKAEVARRALQAGASIVNDITALAGDPDMPRVLAACDAGVVLMHMQGTPATMQLDPRYEDVVAEVYEFLARRVEWAETRGIGRDRIAIDPGIGFGKTFEHNLELLRNLGRFATLGCAVLVGTSRKGFLGRLTGRPVSERAAASAVSSLAALARGAHLVRVHDVGPMADAIKVWEAVHGWGGAS
jgi:dihydropteroate synthase